jgi:alkylation response protein AidB-like acyl-CoA dehydrogenase
MDFRLSAEQQQFAAALHDLLAAADGPAAARAWAAGNREPGLKIWRSLADAGVTALAVPAEHGGLGASPVDLVIACEEAGHHAIPGPVAESFAAIPTLLAELDRLKTATIPTRAAVSDVSSIPQPSAPVISRSVPAESTKRQSDGKQATNKPAEFGRWLRQLASGDLIATVAMPPLVPFAADAEVAGLVLLANSTGVWIGEPAPSRRSVDPTRKLSDVTAGQPVAEGSRVAWAVARALNFGTLACAAQLLGTGRALLEASAAHAQQRVQFGQPVGAFQAVKHQLADVLIKLEFARPLLLAAAITVDQDQDLAGRDVSAAKVACTDAAYLAARVALQVHGAIGYTAEHDAGLWFTKVRALQAAWGTPRQHRARVLAALTCG